MKVRVIGAAEHDRHDDEIRFVAQVNGTPVSVTMTIPALFVVCEARGVPLSDPIAAYAAGGSLIEKVVADTIVQSGSLERTYLVTQYDVLRVTGTLDGLPHVPKPWPPR